MSGVAQSGVAGAAVVPAGGTVIAAVLSAPFRLDRSAGLAPVVSSDFGLAGAAGAVVLGAALWSDCGSDAGGVVGFCPVGAMAAGAALSAGAGA